MRFEHTLRSVRGFLGRGTCASRPAKFLRRLELERLEMRAAPVVGAFAIPPAVPRGGLYDGVVEMVGGGRACSGTLLYSGRHILTAAHCNRPAQDQVRFEMARGANPVDIFVNVPAGNPFQIVHPSYVTPPRGYDIAVTRLIDQEPGFQQADRHLVAPFGAQRYDLYRSGDEIGQVSTMVGYGNTGTGATGEAGGGGVKRLGQNHVTKDGSGWMDANPSLGLLTDFDDGTSGTNRLGDNLGLGAAEASVAHGDSGGPLFIGNRIAGIPSWLWDYNPPSGYGGFSDVTMFTRVSQLMGWVDSTVGAGSYHLVLDMNQQVLGQDGLTENVTITARVNGENLWLWVNAPAFSGLYYSAPVFGIQSLTIRGSGDHETITVEPGLPSVTV